MIKKEDLDLLTSDDYLGKSCQRSAQFHTVQNAAVTYYIAPRGGRKTSLMKIEKRRM